MAKKNEILILLVIVFICLFLNIYNNNFPLNYHADEPKKVRFIKDYTQDFHHPLLMLQAVRINNLFFGFSEEHDIVRLGRISTAIFGTLIVFLSYLIVRNTLDRKYALIVALAVAISPIIVIHSHYLKEDIVFTCFSLLSILLLMNFIQHPNRLSTLLLGLSTGLALSSHYKGILLIPILLAAPVLSPCREKLNYYKRIFISLVISLFTFMVVNYPIIFDFHAFKKGFLFEARHTLEGHILLKIHAIPNFFAFHLINSIVPGMTLLLTILALLYIAYTVYNWKKTAWQDKILLLYVLLFYSLVELSPSKPFPDFMRYVIPIIPIMIYFAYKGIRLIDFCLKSPIAKSSIGLVLVATLCLPLYESTQLVYHLNKDTRAKAEKWIMEVQEKAKYEFYASTHADVISLVKLDIMEEQNNGIRYLVASSFVYERVAFGSKMKNQDKRIYEAQKKYQTLFSYPFMEIRPAYKSFAFSNPTIRIIDIRK